MKKIIASEFELDISNYQITEIDENNWFTDDLRLRVTFPFNIDLSDEINEYFNYILNHNTTPEVVFPIFYNHADIIEKGTFEILELNQKTLNCQLSYGDEELSTWDRKLSELSLDNFNLSNSIYEHAASVLNLSWPQTNYNFPAVHIDKIDISTDTWFAFEQMINNYKNGAFIENFVDTVEDITYNKNIMQPLVYWLHVLQRGIADAGYVLDGDILQDPLLQKTLVYGDVQYYLNNVAPSVSMVQFSEDAIFEYFSWPTIIQRFGGIIEVPPGKYRLIGRIILRSGSSNFYNIFFNGQLIESNYFDFAVSNPSITIDINIVVTGNLPINTFEIIAERRQTFGTLIIDLNVNPIRLHDDEGNAIPTIENPNYINLSRAVPDITFGELMKITKNWFNYDWEPVGDKIMMNKIVNQIENSSSVDISKFDVEYPQRKYNKGISFVHRFAEVQHDEYKWKKLYYSNNEYGFFDQIPDSKINEKTNEIEVNALPLPQLFRRGVETAHAFEQNDDKVYAVMYNGLVNGRNITSNPGPLNLPNIFESYFKRWFDFRINAITYIWNIYGFFDAIKNIKSKTKLYGYQKYFIPKFVTKKEIKPNFYELQIEADSLE